MQRSRISPSTFDAVVEGYDHVEDARNRRSRVQFRLGWQAAAPDRKRLHQFIWVAWPSIQSLYVWSGRGCTGVRRAEERGGYFASDEAVLCPWRMGNIRRPIRLSVPKNER